MTGFWRGSGPSRALLAAAGLLAGPAPGFADCDMPTLAPAEVAAGPAAADGRQWRVVTGVMGVCDAGARGFAVDLPGLGRPVETARVQLALTGFNRRYGVHQMAFAVLSAQAAPTPKGVQVTFAARVDGLEHYQLGYTLYLVTAKP